MSDKRAPRRSMEEWMELVTECRQSGLTDAAWCHEHGISPSCFYNAVTRLRKRASQFVTNPRKKFLGFQTVSTLTLRILAILSVESPSSAIALAVVIFLQLLPRYTILPFLCTQFFTPSRLESQIQKAIFLQVGHFRQPYQQFLQLTFLILKV